MDIDGLYWDTEEDKKIAEEHAKQLASREKSLTKQETKLNNQIAKINSNTKLSDSEKQKRVGELNSELSNVQAMKSDVQAAQTELTAMSDATEMAFTFNTVSGNIAEIEHGKNKQGHTLITINNLGDFGNRSHELKHGYQVLTGQMTPSSKSSKDFIWSKNSHPHITEAEAHQRQYAVGASLPLSEAGPIKSFSQINRGWVAVIYYYDANGRKVYPYLSRNY